MKRTSMICLVLVAGILGCRREGLALTGSQRTSFGAARLFTEYRRDLAKDHEFALLHVLFVPGFEVPKYGYGGFSTGGGTIERYELQYGYAEMLAPRRSIRSQPVVILNGRTAEGGGRSFLLDRGNVLVATVGTDGAIQVDQLPLVLRTKTQDADSVLAAIKTALPANHRVQALQPSQS